MPNPSHMADQAARTRAWLKVQTPALIDIARESYADYLRVPYIETNGTFESSAELGWLYNEFRAEIDEFDRVANIKANN